jgi:hypothetical protein
MIDSAMCTLQEETGLITLDGHLNKEGSSTPLMLSTENEADWHRWIQIDVALSIKAVGGDQHKTMSGIEQSHFINITRLQGDKYLCI